MALWKLISPENLDILVNVRSDRSSPYASERLQAGALVEELQFDGNRLNYKRASGTGPETGWVSVKKRDDVHSNELLIEDAGCSEATSLVAHELFIQADGANLKGYCVWDKSFGEDKRPLVLHLPSVLGMTSFDYERTERVATMGYVGLMVDTYGDGYSTENIRVDRRACWTYMMYCLGDRAAFRRRLLPFFDWGKNHPLVNPKQTAAYGYCYGAAACMELVRAKTDISGVACFHSYDIANAELGKIEAGNSSQVLLLHGTNDVACSAEEIQAVLTECKEAGVNASVVWYKGGSHGFAHKPNGGPGYSHTFDQQSWQEMSDFFTKVFQGTSGQYTAQRNESYDWPSADAEASSQQIDESARFDEAVRDEKWACCPPPKV